MSRNGGPRRAGFTLVELLVVIAIIGIIITLILLAARDGVRRAEERATQSLITKLDFAVADRIDALFNTQAPINQTHRFLAAINSNASGAYTPLPGSIEARAQVIAQNDFIRAEFPDVFFLNSKTSDGTTYSARYPLNFAGAPYPLNNPAGITDFMLPLGHTTTGVNTAFSAAFVSTATGSTGIFGASYSAAAGLYKNLGYRKVAYDGVDNTGNGIIDEYAENKFDSSLPEDQKQIKLINDHLASHTHKTARSEALYAVLVEGLGPLGSVFNREDFTDKEVQDTDKDGMPEFVDAWNEPLQFYRWPIYFGTVAGSSDSQQGSAPYGGPSFARQQDTYDPNQQLVAPGWWYKTANKDLTAVTGAPTDFAPPNSTGTSGNMSKSAIAFSSYFRSLVDPRNDAAKSPPQGFMWDRSDAMNRRAYFSKFLILSSGPDKEPGVGQFNKDYRPLVDNATGVSFLTFPDATSSIATNARYLTLIENQAAQEDPSPTARTGSFWEAVPGAAGSNVSAYLQQIAGADDITNHNITAPGSGVR